MYSVKDFLDNKKADISKAVIQNNTKDEMQESETSPKRPFIEYERKYSKDREIQLMQELYSMINSYLYPFVVSVLNEYEYDGSPIYNTQGIDRETLAQIIDRVIKLAEESLDQVSEINEEEILLYFRGFDRIGLLKSAVESLILTDIFMIRRPEYFENR